MNQQIARRTSNLIDSLGVVTHINYTNGEYADVSKVDDALAYLGVNHLRDEAPNPNYDLYGQVHLGNAADAGMKLTFCAQGGVDPATVIARIHAFEAAHLGSVVGIEGPNEVNNWPVTYNGQSGTTGAQAYQQALYNAAKADPLLKNVPVLGFTDYPNHASASDWNNIHPYPKNGDEPRATIASDEAAQAAVDPGKSFAITEFGYHTSLTADTAGGWEGVDETTQAKLLLNGYMDAADLGCRTTFAYELLDAYPDSAGSNQETHFGLFRLGYSAKPAAAALHNLTSLLRDGGETGGSFATGTLAYEVHDLPATGHSFLTERSDGSFRIILWNEPDIWDEAADRSISGPTSHLTVNLGSTFQLIQVFDPLQGVAAVQSFRDVSSVRIGETDHPLIIQVSGMMGTAGDDTYTGDGAANFFYGRSGNDLIQGGGGGDRLYGASDNDKLYGGDGNDILIGGPGTDLLNGGAGIDTAIYTLPDAVTVNLSITGPQATRGGGADTLVSIENVRGGAGKDVLIGNSGANQISGGGGNDTITGGGGGDSLLGSEGSDSFVYKALADSSATNSALRDRIADFAPAADKIDLSAIDANATLAGDQAFTFIGTAAFSGVAGQLDVIHTAGSTLVQGDVDGDRVRDFQIQLVGNVGVAASSFTL